MKILKLSMVFLTLSIFSSHSEMEAKSGTKPKLVLQVAHASPSAGLSWHPNGKLLASESIDGVVKVIRARDGKVLSASHADGEIVDAAAHSPDGKTMAVLSRENKVEVRRSADGKLLHTIVANHHRSIIGWSPDGSAFAFLSAVRKSKYQIERVDIKLWRVANAKLYTLKGPTAGIGIFSWSPDGRIISATYRDFSNYKNNTVRLWRTRDGKRLHDLQAGGSILASAIWRPDGRVIASLSRPLTLRFWRVADGKLLRTLKPKYDTTRIIWSPDGSLLASMNYNTVQIWRGGDGTLLHTLRHVAQGRKKADYLHRIVWSPDGGTIASIGRSRLIRLWRIADGKLIRVLNGHSPRGRMHAGYDSDDEEIRLAWSPGSGILASASTGYINLWRARDGKLLHSLRGQLTRQGQVGWSPNGRSLTSGFLNDNVFSFHVWHTYSRRLINFSMDSDLRLMRWSPNGRIIATVDTIHMDENIKLWRAHDGKLLRTFRGNKGYMNDVAWRPDGKALISQGRDEKLKLRRASDGKILRIYNDRLRMLWSPDGKKSATISRDGSIHIRRTGHERPLRRLKKAGGVAAWPTKNRLLILVRGGIALQRISDGKLIGKFEVRHLGSSPFAHYLQWSRTGGVIAFASKDYRIHVRRLSDGGLVNSFAAREGGLRGKDIDFRRMVLSPDGKKVLTVSSAGFLHVWRVADGKLLYAIKGHAGGANGAAWRPDGRIIASGSADGASAKLWRASDGKLLATLLIFSDGTGLVHSPDGRFDYTNPRAKQYIAFRIAGKLVESDEQRKLHGKYYSPGLLAKVLR